ncbi:MAG TPA: hypothetical protein V6D17_23545, partial [Candidatus Obscuribacterales bacterium]
MSKIFGRNRSESEGEPTFSPSVDASSDPKPAEKPTSNLNFSSVVRSSFNQAIEDSKEVMASEPKKDNSTLLGTITAAPRGFLAGAVDLVISPLKKSQAQLDKEAAFATVGNLNGGSISANLSHTAHEVGKVTVGLTTEEGRKNIGIAAEKYWENLTTGPWEQRLYTIGQTGAFAASFYVGGSQASKLANVGKDFRALRVAQQVSGKTGSLSTELGQVAKVSESVGLITRTGANQLDNVAPVVGRDAATLAPKGRTLIPALTEAAPSFTTRVVDTSRNALQRGKVWMADTIGIGAPTVATGESAGLVSSGRRFVNFIKRETPTATTAGAKRFLTLSDDGAAAGVRTTGIHALEDVANGTRTMAGDLSQTVERLIKKGGHGADEVKALETIQNVAKKVTKGEAGLDDLRVVLTEQSAKISPKVVETFAPKFTQHIDDLGQQAARLRGGDDILKAVETKVPQGVQQTEALKVIREAAEGMGKGTHTVDDLQKAVKAAKAAGVEVDDLTRLADRAAVMERVEQGFVATRRTLDDMGNTLDDVQRAMKAGSPEFKQVQEVRQLAAEVAQGGMKSEQ